MNIVFMKLPLRVRQALVGAAISIPIGGGSGVAIAAIDGCSVDYVVKEDTTGATAVDQNGDVLEARSK